MSRNALAALALLAALTPAGAQAGPSTAAPTGVLCGFFSTSDPVSPGDQTGPVFAGPIEVRDSAGNPASGTLTCSIQVNGSYHAADDAARVSVHVTGAGALPPTRVSYEAPEGSEVYYCTEFAYDGGPTLYFVPVGVVEGFWSTNAADRCGLAIETGTGSGVPAEDNLDGMLCPPLVLLGDTVPDVPGVLEIAYDGDVTVAGRHVWECPPYDWDANSTRSYVGIPPTAR